MYPVTVATRRLQQWNGKKHPFDHIYSSYLRAFTEFRQAAASCNAHSQVTELSQ
eukprot:m.41437 g.41437  ORF g.41437 m.41437 type:complete len:54 (-) comp10556_c0_seq2:1458-1619(-)